MIVANGEKGSQVLPELSVLFNSFGAVRAFDTLAALLVPETQRKYIHILHSFICWERERGTTRSVPSGTVQTVVA